MSGIKTKSFGGEGGGEFDPKYVQTIGLRSGKYVDQININHIKHGGEGGGDQGEIYLAENEYINKVEIRSGKYVDNFSISTNIGNRIGGGGDGGGYECLENIRVLSIGGRSGGYVDQLKITYVEDYTPSESVIRNVGVIIGYTPPHTEHFEYHETQTQMTESYTKVTETMVNQNYSASLEIDYYAKVKAETSIEFKDLNMTTISNELQQKLVNVNHTKTVVPEKEVGVLVVKADIMINNGTYWLYPTSVVSSAIIPISDSDNLLNHYDLTGELYVQMPGLEKHKIEQNGYTYYKK